MVAAIERGDIDTADRIAHAHAQQIVKQIQASITADHRVNANITL